VVRLGRAAPRRERQRASVGGFGRTKQRVSRQSADVASTSLCAVALSLFAGCRRAPSLQHWAHLGAGVTSSRRQNIEARALATRAEYLSALAKAPSSYYLCVRCACLPCICAATMQAWHREAPRPRQAAELCTNVAELVGWRRAGVRASVASAWQAQQFSCVHACKHRAAHRRRRIVHGVCW
jgi:hypothetical protein